MNDPVTHFRLRNQGSIRDQLNTCYELLGRLQESALNAITIVKKGDSRAASQQIERMVLETLANAQEERQRREAINRLADEEERKARQEDREREEALQQRQGRDTWQKFGNARHYE